jgi:hypothetical protein
VPEETSLDVFHVNEIDIFVERKPNLHYFSVSKYTDLQTVFHKCLDLCKGLTLLISIWNQNVLYCVYVKKWMLILFQSNSWVMVVVHKGKNLNSLWRWTLVLAKTECELQKEFFFSHIHHLSHWLYFWTFKINCSKKKISESSILHPALHWGVWYFIQQKRLN